MEDLYQPGQVSNPQLKLNLASHVKRLLAKVLDYIIMIWPVALTLLIFGEDYKNDIISFIEGIYIIAIGITNLIFLTAAGQTIGKKIVKIRIIKMGTWDNGGFVTNVLIRTIVCNLISSLTCSIFSIVDYCFIFRADRRCVHDLIASTYVVNNGYVFLRDEYNQNNGLGTIN